MSDAATAKDPAIAGVSVILDFGPGHITRRGETHGHYSQSDVIDEYGRSLIDEMENEAVRLHMPDTRRPPGLTETQRFMESPGNYLPLIVSSDWFAKPRMHNSSTVEYRGEQYFKLCKLICEGLSEWGRCYVWGHRVSQPVPVEGAYDFIRIKPFAINGPHADEYLKRLDQLGVSVARSIGSYLLERNMGRIKIKTRTN